MFVICWPVLENEVPFDSDSSRLGLVDATTFTISIIANKPSFSPPRIKLPSGWIADPDSRSPEVDIGHVRLGPMECLVGCPPAELMSRRAVADPHRKLQTFLPEESR